MKLFTIAFDYTDKEGKKSKRIFDIRQIQKDEVGQFFYTGFCHSKKGIRTFRGDRMNCITSVRTGEFFESQSTLLNAIKIEAPALEIGIKKHSFLSGFIDEISTTPTQTLFKCIHAKIDTNSNEQKRLTTLLKSPINGQEDGWAFWLPPCFNLALDIQITLRVLEEKESPVPVWTQGSKFDFHKGDIIFDGERTGQTWAEEMREFCAAVQVLEAQPSTPATIINENGEKTIIPRNPGVVRFSILKVGHDKTSLDQMGEKATTQDEFVKILICGLPKG